MKQITQKRSELSLLQARQLLTLWDEVWGVKDYSPIEERIADFLEDSSPEQQVVEGSELFHLIEEDDKVVGAARSFERLVRLVDSQEKFSVLALAGVCVSPVYRGRGFGVWVVLDAFSRIGGHIGWSLFQTNVPVFYENLGAIQVANEFVNSLDEASPEARPWWDGHVMVMGDQQKWPEARVDLLGVAY